MQKYRYYTRSPDGRAMYGFGTVQGAETAAREYGEGAFIVDTRALTYEPMVQMVKDGEVVYFGVSGWNTNKLNESQNMIEGIRNGHVAIVHAFIERGADVNYVDKTGGTPLHWAAARGRRDIVELLLHFGADPTRKDTDGEIPRDIARLKKRDDIFTLLDESKKI
jgi:hypothetical protein